jgi:hemerythrin-like domain-containing protein
VAVQFQETIMSTTRDSSNAATVPTTRDGFEVLDACHREILRTLNQLDSLVLRLGSGGPDAQARAMAGEIVRFFANTARQHHEDEERHVFPNLLNSGDPDIVQAVQRLQQDHHWLEADWRELGPQLDAVAGGQSWTDVDVLREGAEVFAALLHDHIALEESVIYPQARARLRAGELREMGREMAARRRAERLKTEPSSAAPRRRG